MKRHLKEYSLLYLIIAVVLLFTWIIRPHHFPKPPPGFRIPKLTSPINPR